MINLFFLEYQHYRLFNKIQALPAAKKAVVLNPIFDINAKITSDTQYMNAFRYKTRSLWDGFKSIIPGTTAFKARYKWAKNINNIRSDIDYLCNLKDFKVVDAAKPVIAQLPAEPEIVRLTLPRNFGNPVGMNHFHIERLRSRSRSPSPEPRPKPESRGRSDSTSSGGSIDSDSSVDEVILTKSPDKKSKQGERILFYKH